MKYSAMIAAAGMLAVAAPAFATDFNWSWTDLGTNTTVSGTLFGLNEGGNFVTSGAVNVTGSIFSYMTDSNASHFSGVGSVTVTGGQVTYVSGVWGNAFNGTTLFLGTNPGQTYYPELVTSDYSTNQYNCCDRNAMTFSVAGSPAPEPAAWVMMLAGFGAIGVAMRRQQRTAVSFG